MAQTQSTNSQPTRRPSLSSNHQGSFVTARTGHQQTSKQATTYYCLLAGLLLAEETTRGCSNADPHPLLSPRRPASGRRRIIRHLTRSFLAFSASAGAAGEVPTPRRRTPHPWYLTTPATDRATTTGSPFSFVFFFAVVVVVVVVWLPVTAASAVVSSSHRGWHALRWRTRPAVHTVLLAAASASSAPNNTYPSSSEPKGTVLTTTMTRTTRATHASTSSSSRATDAKHRRLLETTTPVQKTEAANRRTTRGARATTTTVPEVPPSGWSNAPIAAAVAVAVTPEPPEASSSSSSTSSPAAARSRRTHRVLLNDDNNANDNANDDDASRASSPATKSKPGRRAGGGANPVPTKPPKGWQDVYQLVTELRADKTAPCDHSGCEALIDNAAPPSERRFHSLVSLLLSSQTKDAVVGESIRSMQRDNVLTPQAIAAMTPERLNQYIAKVGFHNNKTKYLKQVSDILIRDYNGDIPPTADAMMELPGIGPKMAYICESVAWQRSSGIGVDTHMHRLFNALGWVRSKTPEQTRLQLQAWLPIELWPTVNLLWVGFGQEVQQFQPKILRKALACSRPADALRLLKRCGLDVSKEGKKLGLEEEIRAALQTGKGQDL